MALEQAISERVVLSRSNMRRRIAPMRRTIGAGQGAGGSGGGGMAVANETIASATKLQPFTWRFSDPGDGFRVNVTTNPSNENLLVIGEAAKIYNPLEDVPLIADKLLSVIGEGGDPPGLVCIYAHVTDYLEALSTYLRGVPQILWHPSGGDVGWAAEECPETAARLIRVPEGYTATPLPVR